MSKANKVEIQKGPIDPAMKTMKTMTYAENVKERREQMALTRSGQTQTLHEPKSGRK